MMMVRVSLAYLAVGSRNAITPLLTASTPVIAVQPLEKVRNRSQALTAPVAATQLRGRRPAGSDGRPPASVLNTPTPISPSRQAMNM